LRERAGSLSEPEPALQSAELGVAAVQLQLQAEEAEAPETLQPQRQPELQVEAAEVPGILQPQREEAEEAVPC